jgi:hypothetical protein
MLALMIMVNGVGGMATLFILMLFGRVGIY